MKILDPKVELLEQKDPISHVAKCARVCYGKIEGKSSDTQLYSNLIKSGHLSVLRHESMYAIVPSAAMLSEEERYLLNSYLASPYIDAVCYNDKLGYGSLFNPNLEDYAVYIVTNGNFYEDTKFTEIEEIFFKYTVTPKEFNADEIGHQMMRYTFKITTQISTSRELNRVSPNNITERSTRYVDESNGAIVRPHWISPKFAKYWNEGMLSELTLEERYLRVCSYAFDRYKGLLNEGLKREDARGLLPLDTATEVIYTYNVEQWRHIIELRSAKNAHPNAQIIANMIKDELIKLGYDF